MLKSVMLFGDVNVMFWAMHQWTPCEVERNARITTSPQFLQVTVVRTVGQIKGEVLPSHAHTSLGKLAVPGSPGRATTTLVRGWSMNHSILCVILWIQKDILYTYIYIYIYTFIYVYVCLYIYRWRYRNRYRYICIYIYIHRYIHLHTLYIAITARSQQSPASSPSRGTESRMSVCVSLREAELPF